MNKHDNLLKLDINDIHKQEQQSMTTPNNVTNISKSKGGECFRKARDQKLDRKLNRLQRSSKHMTVTHANE